MTESSGIFPGAAGHRRPRQRAGGGQHGADQLFRRRRSGQRQGHGARHPLEGVSLAGKVLVYPGGKGPTGATYTLYNMASKKTAPIAIISPEVDNVTVVGAVLGKIPSVDRVPAGFFDAIKSGQWLELDGDNGIVRVAVNREQGEAR